MPEVKFRMGEKGAVDIFDVPLVEHRRLSKQLGVIPDIYVHNLRQGIFYKVVAMIVSGVEITYYSIDSLVSEADAGELAIIEEIKEARRKRLAEESDD